MTTAVCEAIRRRRLLQFDYHGLQRIVAPYCHGISTRGTDVLRAVQLRGESSSGGFGFGKLWTVADMRNAQVLPESFLPNDPDYNPDDSAMQRIHCRV
jgi:hypothetical protein